MKLAESVMKLMSDKTGKHTIDEKSNYKECMKEHVENDEIVGMKEYEKVERNHNAHAAFLSRIFGIGADHGHEGRVKEAVVVLNSHPPDLYGLRKDHKELEVKARVSEESKEMIGDAIDPANCLSNVDKENEVGGKVDLANNPVKNKDREVIGGRSQPVNNQNENENLIEEDGSLANNQAEEEICEIKEKEIHEKSRTRGPKLRPVVGANKASSRPISHILSKVLYKVTEVIGRKVVSNCESTEEMICEIENVNEKLEDKESIVIGSLDIVKWYPSMEIKRILEIVKELIIEAEIEVEIVDYERLSIYIAANLDKNEIENEKLEQVIHRRKEGKRAGLTNKHILVTEGENSQWEEPKRKPNKFERKKMLAVAICIGVKLVMENHIYQFGGELRKQRKGGPIGVELTGALADLVMLHWDRKFLETLEKVNISVKGYKRFKDDTNIMLRPVDRTLKYEGGKLIKKTEKEINSENKLENDEISMEVVKSVADSLEEMIKTEIDFPSKPKNKEKKMPILDIQVWVKEVVKENGVKSKQIYYEFYEKPMASKFVMMQRSAAPLSQKRTVLTQEGIRRLKNCKLELNWAEKTKHLDGLMQKIKNSGYEEKFRLEVLKSSINGFAKRVEDSENETNL